MNEKEELRPYFRTHTKELTDGLIRNFELNMLPANPGVRTAFGIIGDDDARLFDALRWLWNHGHLDRAQLLAMKSDGAALTRAANLPDNPFAPVEYETLRDALARAHPELPLSKGGE